MLLCSGHACCGAGRLHIGRDATRALALAGGAVGPRLQVAGGLGYLRPSGSTAVAGRLDPLSRQRWKDPMATIFDKIIAREIPADIVHEDDLCIAFRDINPQAPVHVLLVPKKPIVNLADASPDDQALLGHLMLVAPMIAEQLGVGGAFRLNVNNGAAVGQSVFHLHLHILGGRPFAWPPG